STGTNTLTNNTVTGNGVGTAAGAVTTGIRLDGAGNLADRNVIAGNYGAGILVNSGASTNRITRNSISANGSIPNLGGSPSTGQLGIDLQSASDDAAAGTAPFVTLNDNGDGDGGANGLLNTPVIETAVIAAGNLTLTGWARPGSAIELFLSDGDPSGFGEGVTYLTTLTEGSGADLD